MRLDGNYIAQASDEVLTLPLTARIPSLLATPIKTGLNLLDDRASIFLLAENILATLLLAYRFLFTRLKVDSIVVTARVLTYVQSLASRIENYFAYEPGCIT